jgi:hypothetical protein
LVKLNLANVVLSASWASKVVRGEPSSENISGAPCITWFIGAMKNISDL